MSDTGPSPTVRQQVRFRARYMCERCELRHGVQIHHRAPRKMGGTRDPQINSPANLLYLCSDCHAWIESHRESAIRDGQLILRNTTVPFDPVEHHFRDGWGIDWILKHDGTKARVAEESLADVGDEEWF